MARSRANSTVLKQADAMVEMSVDAMAVSMAGRLAGRRAEKRVCSMAVYLADWRDAEKVAPKVVSMAVM